MQLQMAHDNEPFSQEHLKLHKAAAQYDYAIFAKEQQKVFANLLLCSWYRSTENLMIVADDADWGRYYNRV